ncbi:MULTISPECIES: gluconate 5-dehydrogenase [Bacteroidota]|uniref:gluconate 5-dehydrogenase n=1 Tax=Flavobacteriaceae TaxID=49546 RepID=UPI0040477EDF
MKLFDLSGKTAFVSGATHGLGMAMATGLAEAGASIIISSTSTDKLNQALADYKSKGFDASGVVLDVTDDEQVASVTSNILSERQVDVLVNNAGIIKRIPALEMSPNEFRKVIDVHLTGSFHMAQQFAKPMVARQSGKIINICSMMSELGRNTVTAYAAAKGGLKMLTRNLATEWAKHNIQVNGIGPGYFATSQTEPIRVNGHPFNDFIVNRTPAGRWGKTDDLKGTAVFLASAASDFINGQIIYVDGGILATIGKPSNEN